MNDLVIIHIRQLRLKGMAYLDLARQFNLPIKTVRIICKNIKGSHIAARIQLEGQYRRRVAFGESAGSAKLKEQHVRTIRDLIDQGFALKQIAALYGVDISTISDISTGRSWAHLPQNDEETGNLQTG